MTIAEQRHQALILLQSGAFAQAAPLIDTCLVACPTDSQLLAAKGFLLAQTGALDKASDALQAAIQSDPHSFTAFNHLGNVYRARGDYEQALRAYHEALRIKPNYPEALNNLGALHYRQGKFAVALKLFEKALRLDSNAIDILYNVANTYVRLDNPQMARQHYERLLKLSPEHLGANHNLGILLVSLGQLSHAKPLLKKALARDTKALDAHYHLALILTAEGAFQDAVDLYQKVITFEPKHAHAHHNLATLYLSLQKPGLAISHFETAFALNPQNTTAKHFIDALNGQQTASPPPGFVKDLFDFYAQNYDQHLRETLEYQVPYDLRALVAPYKPLSDNLWFGIDIGCGTGLCAPAFADIIYRLIGIDLSGEMLTKAKTLGAYHRLHEGDISTVLAQHYCGVANIIIAGDVLGYIGALDTLFQSVSKALKPGGFFALSIELNDHRDWFLEPTGRYSHTQDYIHRTAKQFALAPVDARPSTLRQQHTQPLRGLCILLKKETD